MPSPKKTMLQKIAKEIPSNRMYYSWLKKQPGPNADVGELVIAANPRAAKAYSRKWYNDGFDNTKASEWDVGEFYGPYTQRQVELMNGDPRSSEDALQYFNMVRTPSRWIPGFDELDAEEMRRMRR